MQEKESWDWNTDLKEIPVKEWNDRFNWVQGHRVSPDGEKIAAVVNVDEMAFGICVNGETWEGEYEKAWQLTQLPDNRFAAFVCNDEEWTLAIDGQEWEDKFDFIWDLKVNPAGDKICAAVQTDMEYGMAVNGQPWEEMFDAMTGMIMSPNGNTAAVVQVKAMAAADTEAYRQGLFSAAINGKALDTTFLNIWDLQFDAAGENIAYVVRTEREAYTVVVNETAWDGVYQSAWQPLFDTQGRVLAPVRQGGAWKLFRDGKPLWKTGYDQLWQLCQAPGKEDIAAIVSPKFGQWTVAVNDKTWQTCWDAMVSDITYSENGQTLVARAKHGEIWDLAVNDTPWGLGADQLFDPVVSSDGNAVAVVAEKKGAYHLAVNNRMVATGYEMMAAPVFSPDNGRVLVKGIENGVYKRRIISL
ncbi:MAG: Tmc redox complex protein TmcD [Desulfobacterales bacterium]|nr:Tmc redox complex protein TmcD [Desulfobacterales bacterium]